MEHWELAHKIFTEMDVVEREALIFEMSGDRCFDAGSLEEAIEAYDRCLMIVQEDGDLQKEARVLLMYLHISKKHTFLTA